MLDAQDHAYLQETFVTKTELRSILSDAFGDFRMEIGEMITDIVVQLTEHFSTELRNTEIRIMSVFIPHNQKEEEHYQELNEKYHRVMTAVDKLVGPIADLQQEFAFAKGQHERQIEWNHKVAKKIDVPFDY